MELVKILKGRGLNVVKKSTAPTPGSNTYPVPTLWIDQTSKTAYLLLDITDEVATWVGLGSNAYDYIDLPIEAFLNGAAPPSEATTITSGNGKTVVRKFSGTQSEDVTIRFPVPEDMDVASGFSFRVFGVITESTGPSNQGLAFVVSGFSTASGEASNGTFGDEVTLTITELTEVQYDDIETGWSSAVIFTGVAAGEKAQMKFYRDHDHASDNYAQDFGVDFIRLRYLRKPSIS